KTVGRPLAIADLAYDLRLDPCRRLCVGDVLLRKWLRIPIDDGAFARTRVAHDWIERCLELFQQLVVKTSTDASGVDELATHHVGDLQGAETAAATLWC